MTADKKTRRGFTLIEVLTSMAIGSMIVGIAVGLLYLLLEMERTGRDQLRGRTTVNRLADRFREDVHAATRLTALDAPGADGRSPPGWQLQLPGDEVVVYRLEEGELLCVASVDGTLRQQEAFPLAEGAAVSIEQSAGRDAPLVSLRITCRSRPPAETAFLGVCIEAILAKDHRYLESKEP